MFAGGVIAIGLALGLTACVPREREQSQEERELREATAVKRARGSKSGADKSPQKPIERKTTPKPIKRRRDPALTEPFRDAFDRTALGTSFVATSPRWRIENEALCVSGARNHPVWLARRLPVNAIVEFDAVSSSPDGDIKAEFWGDGASAARGVSYEDATSYLTIFGGWKNQFHVLARIDEHAKDRPEVRLEPDSDDLRARPVEPNRKYHFRVEREDGKTVRWLVDDLEILSYADDRPLSGEGHEYFGFNNWEVPVCFDNLAITPLPPS